MPAIPALGRQRQKDHCSFEASLGYRANSGPACDIEHNNNNLSNNNKDRTKNQAGDRERFNQHGYTGKNR